MDKSNERCNRCQGEILEVAFCPKCPCKDRDQLQKRDRAIIFRMQFALAESLEQLRMGSLVLPVISNSVDAICIEPPKPYTRKPIISFHRVDDKEIPGAQGHIERLGQEFKVPSYLWTYNKQGLRRKVAFEGW